MRRLLGALAVVAVVAPAARAQDAVRITEADVNQKGSWGDRADKPVVLENVKFRGYSLPVIDIQNVKSGKLRGPDQRLANALPTWHTPSGDPLDRKGRSNVRITGVARDDGETGDRFVEVNDVVKMPDDVSAFNDRLKKCKSPDEIMALAKEATARAEAYTDVELRAWTLKAYESALKQKQDALPKNDGYAKAAIEIARSFKQLAANQNLGIELLNAVFYDAATNAADKDTAQQVLMKELEASQFQGKWIPREVFKKALGYVAQGKDSQGGTIWVRRERIEFFAEKAKETPVLAQDPNPRKGSAFIYEQAATKGELVNGMYKTEVVRTKGYSFPDFVDRIEEKQGSNTITWDQWILSANEGNGIRLYFVNGVLYDVKQKADAWLSPDSGK